MLTSIAMLVKLTILIANLLYSLAKAQSSLTPSNCVGSISSFPQCDSVNTILQRCNNISEKQAIIDCLCNQRFINSWIGCKSEFRQCSLSNSFDSMFDSYLVEWHGACDTHLSALITTPSVTVLTATLEQGVCEAFYESCDRWSRGYSSCTKAQRGDSYLTSCRCSGSMPSMASVCKIDGSQSCLQSSANITQLWEYQNCPGASTIFGQGITTERTSQTRTTIPPLTAVPSVTPVFGPQSTLQSTTSSRSWADSKFKRPMKWLLITGVVMAL